MEEPPETPAPVFAVRAFKTALFGTPHTNQYEEAVVEEKASPEQPSKPKHSPRTKFSTPKIGHKLYATRTQKITPLMSPAKGILVTPGTAAGRRKTVSFGSLGIGDGVKLDQPYEISKATTEESTKVSIAALPGEAKRGSHSQPTLTKELFEVQLDASKQRLNEQRKSAVILVTESSSSGNIQNGPSHPAQSASTDPALDFTVDLTKPRSQSGQHWKAEYERFQKNSDRELKKIIQHGQHVKSYAEKKDVEATDLHQKLERELAKCASMEHRVSKLAAQLASSKGQGLGGNDHQEKLMNDLSRQTALAIRYKQKADRYRIAIRQQKSSAVGGVYDGDRNNTEDSSVDITSAAEGVLISDHHGEHSELNALRNELSALRSELGVAEEKAARLGAVNAKLTENFLRVKDEMQNYDARRVRKETRLKKREETLIAEKRACEGKLKHLTKEHQDLLQSIESRPMTDTAQEPLPPTNTRGQSSSRKRTSPLPEPSPGIGQVHLYDPPPRKPSSIDPRAPQSHLQNRPKSEGPAIDIWTTDSPNDTADTTPPADEPAINLSHVALSEATNNALREIDSNSISDFPSEPPLPPDTPRPTLEHLAKMDSALQPDFPSSDSYQSSAVKRMNDRRNTIPSPRPSMVNMASSVMKEENMPRASGLQRNASLVSTAGSRKLTLNGGSRVGELPPDRAAAAKARLAQRKSMKENRQR